VTNEESATMIACPRCGAYAGDRCHSMASSGWKVVKTHAERVARAKSNAATMTRIDKWPPGAR
jgi:hypothetical protein